MLGIAQFFILPLNLDYSPYTGDAMKLSATFVLALFATTSLWAQNIRICTYNVLNYSLANEDGRSTQFRKILEQIQPDILVTQEMVEDAAAEKLSQDVFAPGSAWLRVPFNDGPDTDNALFYNGDKIKFLQSIYHHTALRDIAEYILITNHSKDTLRIFSLHLKSDTGAENIAARHAEAAILEQRLQEIYSWDVNAKIAVVGDFNFYSTSEDGYKTLTAAPTAELVDPLSGWVANDASNALKYTQSTRTVADGACGGGTTGGLDDRFDFIFTSAALSQKFQPNSYIAYGNDGQARLNSSIDNPPNTVVSADLAAALRCASDHLPVYADFAFGASVDVEDGLPSNDFSMRIYPMPVTDAQETLVEFTIPKQSYIAFSVCDLFGRTLYTYSQHTPAGTYKHHLKKLSAGTYIGRVTGDYTKSQIIIVK